MNDYIEMEVAIVEGLEDEVSVLRDQIKTLSDFLMANFGDEIGIGDIVPRESPVEKAVRLLSELKARRDLASAKAEIVRLTEAEGHKGGVELPRPWVSAWDEPKGEGQ